MSHQSYPDGTDPHTIPLDVPYKTPPAGQTSNFDHPDVTLRNSIIITASITLAFALLTAVARFGTRIFIVKRFGWDDYICVVAVVIVIAFNAASLERELRDCSSFIFMQTRVADAMVSGIQYGLGVPTWDQRLRYYFKFYQNPFVYWFSVMTILRHFGLMLLKLSILALYLRIMGDARDVHRKTRYMTIFAIVWVVGYNFGLLGWLLGLCDPVQKFFYPQIAGNCKYSGVWKELSTWSAMNVFTDFLIFVLPLPLVWQLHMSLSQKIGVVLTLATGLMVCAATIVNLVISVKIIYQKSTEDPLQLWAIIEMNIGLICVCLPAMKQLLSRSIPFFSKRYGSGGSSGGSTRKKSVPNDGLGNMTPAGRRRSIFDPEADADSTANVRLTHEMKQFNERNEKLPDESTNRYNHAHGYQSADMGERPGYDARAKDSIDMGMSTFVHAQ